MHTFKMHSSSAHYVSAKTDIVAIGGGNEKDWQLMVLQFSLNGHYVFSENGAVLHFSRKNLPQHSNFSLLVPVLVFGGDMISC